LQIIGPGPTPVTVQLSINGSNFFPGTALHTAITFKGPEKGPALVAVNGIQQCIVINGQTILRVRVIDENGFPLGGIPVTFTSPGINTNLPSVAFLPGINAPVITVFSDDFGFAPPLDDSATVFQANPFKGPYVVSARAVVGATKLTMPFNLN